MNQSRSNRFKVRVRIGVGVGVRFRVRVKGFKLCRVEEFVLVWFFRLPKG